MSDLENVVKSKKKKRTIDLIRKAFPQHKWKWDQDTRHWEAVDAGWYIFAEAHMAPKYDGDDETFVVRYRRSDTNEPVYIGEGMDAFFSKHIVK